MTLLPDDGYAGSLTIQGSALILTGGRLPIDVSRDGGRTWVENFASQMAKSPAQSASTSTKAPTAMCLALVSMKTGFRSGRMRGSVGAGRSLHPYGGVAVAS